ncbi:hypothetical protein BKA56DRAFT_730005 [Ilyonectria sp. MPI-CAGE-AT-0026]|nr:hypothetical protein BKA56DRAFT_730005 [Ilyonectria sp. MPI-CAGE-AT-0026]
MAKATWPSSAHWTDRDYRVEMVKGNLTFLVWKRSGERTLLKEANSLLEPYGAISKVENLEKEVQDLYFLPLSVIVEFEMFDARRDVLSVIVEYEMFDARRDVLTSMRIPSDRRIRNVRRSRSSSNSKCSTLSVIVEFEMFDARRDVLKSRRIPRDS